MNEAYYIFHYPSAFGMGSDVDELLVTESDMERMIRLELQKKAEGDRYSDRLTGEWDGESPCDSADAAEVVRDVIAKRLSTCSTYAGVNDLIELPADTPVEARERSMENVVFHIWNQFLFPRDVIMGKVTFQEAAFHLEHGLSRLFEGGYDYRFLRFAAERVLEFHYFPLNDTLEHAMEQDRFRLEHAPEDFRDEQEKKKWDRYIAESRANLEKLSRPPVSSEDAYLSYVYRPKWKRKYAAEMFEHDLAELQETDHRMTAFSYPLAIPTEGALYRHHRETADKYRYEELFQKGMDAELIPYVLSGRKKPAEASDGDLLPPIEYVFGYE